MKKFTRALFFVGLLFTSHVLYAQIYWNFNTASPTSNSFSNVTVGQLTQGNNFGTTTMLTSTSASTGYPGFSGGNNAGLAAQAIGYDPAQTAYFQVVLTPTGSNSVVLTGIGFGSRSTATGPQAVSIRSSVDNYSTDLLTFTLEPTSVWALYSNNLSLTGIAGTPVTLRLYGYNGAGTPTSGTTNWRIDDLVLNPVLPLPVSLTSFNASFNGKTTQLKWSTAGEINVKGFSVEKSLNSIDFSEIAFVKAGTSPTSAGYYAEDNNVTAPVNYYRLKLIDNDGSAKFSRTVVVNTSNIIKLEVFPNPAVSTISILHPKALYGTTATIVDTEGKQLKKYTIEEGATLTSLPVANLSKGTYMVIIQNGGGKSITSFIKQ